MSWIWTTPPLRIARPAAVPRLSGAGNDCRTETSCSWDKLDVGWRTRNDTQDVGGSRLLLKRFSEVARARLHLVEQTHVLNRNYGLIRESLEQVDLTFRERYSLGPAKPDDPDGLALAH